MRFRIFFFFNDTATTEIYTLSLHDALPIYVVAGRALLQGAAHRHVVDLARIDAGLVDHRADGLGGERRAVGVVERAAVGLADGGPAGGDDDGFTHGEIGRAHV